LETGEIFEGDPLEVTTKLAEAQVNTKRWGQKGYAEATEWKQKAEAPPPPPPKPEQQPLGPIDPETARWVAEASARGKGFPSLEAQQAYEKERDALAEQYKNETVSKIFLAKCQDFPNTQEATEALAKTVEENNWDFTPQSMIAAHALCLREGKYKALDEQEQQYAAGDRAAIAQQRGAPPPMIRSGAPDNNNRGQENPYAMKLEDLRAMAIKQQLEGR